MNRYRFMTLLLVFTLATALFTFSRSRRLLDTQRRAHIAAVLPVSLNDDAVPDLLVLYEGLESDQRSLIEAIDPTTGGTLFSGLSEGIVDGARKSPAHFETDDLVVFSWNPQIFLEDRVSYVVALRKDSGEPAWTIRLPERIEATPLLFSCGEHVLVASVDRARTTLLLNAYSLETGAPEWDRALEEIFRAATCTEDLLHYGNVTSGVSLNLEDGSTLISYTQGPAGRIPTRPDALLTIERNAPNGLSWLSKKGPSAIDDAFSPDLNPSIVIGWQEDGVVAGVLGTGVGKLSLSGETWQQMFAGGAQIKSVYDSWQYRSANPPLLPRHLVLSVTTGEGKTSELRIFDTVDGTATWTSRSLEANVPPHHQMVVGDDWHVALVLEDGFSWIVVDGETGKVTGGFSAAWDGEPLRTRHIRFSPAYVKNGAAAIWHNGTYALVDVVSGQALYQSDPRWEITPFDRAATEEWTGPLPME